MNKEAINHAIAWWLKDMSYPKFETGKEEDLSMCCLTTMLNFARPMPEEDKLRLFVNRLSNAIEQDLLDKGVSKLEVDIEAKGHLNDALNEANIENRLSFKTEMIISEDMVVVSKGFGAPYKDIYTRQYEDITDYQKVKDNK